MCGIAGIVGTPPEDLSVLERMNGLLHHRGPDSQGSWTSPTAQLTHTRLAIIDLSKAGNQPMRDGSLVLVYNGEVYNFRELRSSLPGPFHSETDTEVVLRSFREHGAASVSRLRGMFAYAIWDEAEQSLFLARDRFGIKPLYYRPLDGGLAFASEVGPLLELAPPSIDLSTMRDYLTYGYVPTPKTPWEGIFKLPAAHTLCWRDGAFTTTQYWKLEPHAEALDFATAAAEIEALLEEAVAESSVADVPLGLLLSGGVDSATVASFNRTPLLTFTLGQRERHRDESEAARILSRHLGTTHHELTAEVPNLSESLDVLVSTFQEPFGDSAALSVWLISRLVSEHVKVAHSGEGGDELFYGYRWHGKAMTDPPSPFAAVRAWLTPTLTRAGRSARRRASEGISRYASFVGTFTPEQVQALAGPAIRDGAGSEDPLWALRRYWRDDLPLQKRLQFADLHTYLPDDLLMKVDRASMAWSLEVRPPLLDHRLVELAASLDPALHRDPETDQGKLIPRSLLQERLPKGYLDRPKKGFNLPIARWVRKEPQMLRGALGRLQHNGLTSRSKGLTLTNDQTWSLLILDRWLTRYSPGYESG